MSAFNEQLTLIREIGQELSLQSVDTLGGPNNNNITLKWTGNGVDMHLHIPREHISHLEHDRQLLKDYIAQRIANGEARETAF